MSGNAAGRIARVPAWVRYGLIAGIIAFACTLAANTAVTWMQPADLCRAGPLIVPLLSLGALVIFLALAAAAGFATARAGTSRPDPILAGVLVGAIGGCALVAMLPLIPGVEHRLQELSSLCPGPGSFGGGSFSSPPPGGMLGDVLLMLVTILVGVVLAVGAASLGGLAGRARRSQVRSGEKP